MRRAFHFGDGRPTALGVLSSPLHPGLWSAVPDGQLQLGAAQCYLQLLLWSVPHVGWHWDVEQLPYAAPSWMLLFCPSWTNFFEVMLPFALVRVTSAGQRQT